MDIPELERLVEIVQNANIRELTLRHGSARLTIRKSARIEMGLSVVGSGAPASDAFLADGVVIDAELEGELGEGGGDQAQVDAEAVSVVTAPLVGVFRHIKPMIGLGAYVNAGQVVGIIEAVKLINEITASIDGTVTEVVIDDGHPVEYGQPLFVLRPGSRE